ncbi:hypothetical protein IMCC3317_31540 [Kordia antarctica]|uniref:Uncharacterized protein n=1 Tax=Kordia antarctica TaxID=1218801 RepID=A0A7L4ZM94_9FLAO|nr:hypothetical protein IMCC3317_31540 [Kordia antarctica]
MEFINTERDIYKTQYESLDKEKITPLFSSIKHKQSMIIANPKKP